MREMLFIMGLGHSGSTVLNMLLTTAGKAVGLGEASRILQQDLERTKARYCSCGKRVTDCILWGPVVACIDRSPKTSAAERYQFVLERIDALYESDAAVIDSSKHPDNLGPLTRLKDVSLTALHNIRDVRGFATSALDNISRKVGRREWPEKLFAQWHRENVKFFNIARSLLNRPPVVVMYEHLCLSPTTAADYLATELGTQYIDVHADLDSGQNHLIGGNRLKKTGTAHRLVYDDRWLARSEWLRPYVLMPSVRKYNQKCHLAASRSANLNPRN